MGHTSVRLCGTCSVCPEGPVLCLKSLFRTSHVCLISQPRVVEGMQTTQPLPPSIWPQKDVKKPSPTCPSLFPDQLYALTLPKQPPPLGKALETKHKISALFCPCIESQDDFTIKCSSSGLDQRKKNRTQRNSRKRKLQNFRVMIDLNLLSHRQQKRQSLKSEL